MNIQNKKQILLGISLVLGAQEASASSALRFPGRFFSKPAKVETPATQVGFQKDPNKLFMKVVGVTSVSMMGYYGFKIGAEKWHIAREIERRKNEEKQARKDKSYAMQSGFERGTTAGDLQAHYGPRNLVQEQEDRDNAANNNKREKFRTLDSHYKPQVNEQQQARIRAQAALMLYRDFDKERSNLTGILTAVEQLRADRIALAKRKQQAADARVAEITNAIALDALRTQQAQEQANRRDDERALNNAWGDAYAAEVESEKKRLAQLQQQEAQRREKIGQAVAIGVLGLVAAAFAAAGQ